jgi:Raf kinase inhibitor-like YbhB/YbcL family protein
MGRRYVPVLLAVAGVLIVSACSDSSSESDPTTTAAGTVATTVTTTSSPPTTTLAPTTTVPAPPPDLVVTSSAYAEGERIPTMYTCDGEDVSPDYTISGLPAETVSIALVMDDPDAPRGVWDHWVVYDIPPTTEIPSDATELGTMGSNSWDRLGYGGPCPPPGDAHRYIVTVYALDALLGLEEGASKIALMTAIEGHVIASGILLGDYSR